jgi:HlyD family secretion protein
MSSVSHQLSQVSAALRAPLGEDRARRKARERRRSLRRNLRHAVLAAGLVAAIAGAVLALRPQPVPVDGARVTRGELSTVIEEDGVTRVKDRFLVSAPVTGSLARLRLEPGDEVKEADSLAEIAPAESPLLDDRTRAAAEARLGAALSALGQARAQVARAAAAHQLAAQELARARNLFSSASLSAHEFEQADFAYRMRAEELASSEFAAKVAAEEVRVARVAAGHDPSNSRDRHIDVLSPVSGRVLRVYQKSAGLVQASTPLVEVGDPHQLEVVVDLLTTDAVRVLPGTPVDVRGWGAEDSIAGRVRRVEPSAFTRPSALGVDEQRVNVIVALSGSQQRWAALGDGFRVQARLVLWQGSKVLRVPQGALFRHGERWALYRIVAGVARLTLVEVGHRGETLTEILSGVPEGAVVAVHPGDRVRDGARVELR